MESYGDSLVHVLATLLRLFSLMLVIYALLSWVIADPRHPVFRFLESMVEPVLNPLRKVLWDFYTEELNSGKDAVEAYASVVEDKEKSKIYKSARGKGGWKRVSWDQATELVAAGQIHLSKSMDLTTWLTFHLSRP